MKVYGYVIFDDGGIMDCDDDVINVLLYEANHGNFIASIGNPHSNFIASIGNPKDGAHLVFETNDREDTITANTAHEANLIISGMLLLAKEQHLKFDDFSS